MVRDFIYSKVCMGILDKNLLLSIEISWLVMAKLKLMIWLLFLIYVLLIVKS
jgi:hypothetical protein